MHWYLFSQNLYHGGTAPQPTRNPSGEALAIRAHPPLGPKWGVIHVIYRVGAAS